MLEGILVNAPWWRFENLVIEGVGGNDNYCEHAFHVVGAATHFVARNNTIINFNAHFKINGENGHFPDGGLIESNTVLGEMVAAAALLSANLKFNGAIIMQIHGDGPVRLMVVECDANLHFWTRAQ